MISSMNSNLRIIDIDARNRAPQLILLSCGVLELAYWWHAWSAKILDWQIAKPKKECSICHDWLIFEGLTFELKALGLVRAVKQIPTKPDWCALRPML